jgi:hypothetical protein
VGVRYKLDGSLVGVQQKFVHWEIVGSPLGKKNQQTKIAVTKI